jgi:glutathione S-transferase
MYQVYGMAESGNCYKVKLLLTQLGLAYRWQETDTRQGATHTPEYLALNPAGKVPLLVLDDGRTLPESNAILCYLAEGSALWPVDRFARAQVLQWMFFEQYSHEPYIAVARAIRRFFPGREAELPALWTKGYLALDVLEQHLRRHDYLVAERYTVADIALYAYTHAASEGGFDLARYPAIQEWLQRVAAEPGHIPLG